MLSQYDADEPGSRAHLPCVKICQKPLVHVHLKAVESPKRFGIMLVLLAYQGRASVRRINMDPHSRLSVVTRIEHLFYLQEAIGGASRCGAKSGREKEGF